MLLDHYRCRDGKVQTRTLPSWRKLQKAALIVHINYQSPLTKQTPHFLSNSNTSLVCACFSLNVAF